jgi:hypothetical protein
MEDRTIRLLAFMVGNRGTSSVTCVETPRQSLDHRQLGKYPKRKHLVAYFIYIITKWRENIELFIITNNVL